MQSFAFDALGTRFTLDVYDGALQEEEKKAILDSVEEFESHFSRFRKTSEVNAFREAASGAYPVSEEFFVLLERAEEMKTLTKGKFDPGLGMLLEKAGYAPSYRFEEEQVETFMLPKWEVSDGKLELSGPTVFDFGGIGK